MRELEMASRIEVETIYRRTIDAFEVLFDQDDEDDDDDAASNARYGQMALLREGLRFCAAAVEALADASLAPIALDVHDRLRRFDSDCEGHHERANRALRAVLAAGAPVDARIRSLARHDDSGVRTAIAKGARATDVHGRALLEALSRDPVAAVRAAARASLSAVAEVPWWSGKWRSDPAARMSESERTAAGSALRRTSELLDEPPHRLWAEGSAYATELLQCLEALPGPLAVEAIEQICLASESYTVDHLVPVMLLMMRREGGLEAFVRLLARWGKSDTAVLSQHRFCKALAVAPRDTRLRLSKMCMAHVSAAPSRERHSFDSSLRLVAAVASGLWPADEDASFVLDALLALDRSGTGDHAVDYAASALQGALTATEGPAIASIRDRIVTARLEGYPGVWRTFGRTVDSLLARLPKHVVRKVAEKAVHSEDDGTMDWGLQMLLGDAYSAKRDGAPVERVTKLLQQRRLRERIVASHELGPKALPGLRAMLARDELSYPEAVTVFGMIRSLYGGLAEPRHSAWVYRSDPDPEGERRKAREEVADFLGPERSAGPPRPEEWDALRRARAAFGGTDTRELAIYWADTLQEGDWTKEERADFDRFLAAFREKPDSEVAIALVGSLAAKPAPELAAVLDEITTRVEGRSRRLMRSGRARVRELMGLAADTVPAARKTELPAGVWEDEDDDVDE